MENSMSPGEISFLGAVAVTAVYILHRLVMGLPAINSETGFFLTVLISSFIAQYIPLSMKASRERGLN
ncbi:MAG: hypothetical protein BRC30_03075 [Nanohaloarchaea archaeon SW_7_46_7]|nr:MAG: hypothetical protein BRC30_03075 [Nanohaloarchaea archaeon SW_7_46_7]